MQEPICSIRHFRLIFPAFPWYHIFELPNSFNAQPFITFTLQAYRCSSWDI